VGEAAVRVDEDGLTAGTLVDGAMRAVVRLIGGPPEASEEMT